MRLARAHGLAIQMNGAGSAYTHSTAIFRSAQVQNIAEHPQQWSIRLSVHGCCTPIDSQFGWHCVTSRIQTNCALGQKSRQFSNRIISYTAEVSSLSCGCQTK